jgi:hypothetical protein
MQKARRHPVSPPFTEGHGAPTACRLTGSGSLSLPSQGCFSPFPHGTGSLSVVREYVALEDGPSGFPRGFTCPGVLGYRPNDFKGFVDGAVTLYGGPSQNLALPLVIAHTTGPTTPPGVATRRFGLIPFRSPLLRESSFLSVPAGTEMFQFPTFASIRLWIQRRIRESPLVGCPIRTSPDHRSFAAPRSFSQRTTSFIAS